MKSGLPASPMAPPAKGAPRLEIGSIAVSGIDTKAAGHLGAAIERAMASAASSGSLESQSHRSLHLEMPHGATEHDIAAALVRALRGR